MGDGQDTWGIEGRDLKFLEIDFRDAFDGGKLEEVWSTVVGAALT